MNVSIGLLKSSAASKYIKTDSSRAPAIAVHVVRTIAEAETTRKIWTGWKTHRDSDIDFCFECVWKFSGFIRPHIILIYRYGCPDAMLVGRLEYARLKPKIGYLQFPSVRSRQLTFSHDGLLGNPSEENSDELLRSIMGSMKEGEADMALFHEYSADSYIYKNIVNLPQLTIRDNLTNPAPHYFMRLTRDCDEVYRGLSSGLRTEIRRKKKKLLEDFSGSVKISCLREPGEVDAGIPAIESIAAKTYQRGLGVGFQNTEGTRHRLRVCAQKGWLRIYLLSLRDRPCAFWMGTLYNGSFCSDEIGFDPQFSRYSPGTVLLSTMIEEFCDCGVQEIDFGPGNAEYKKRFSNCRIMESSIYLFAPNLKGLALNGLRTATGLIDNAARNMLERTNFLAKIKRLWRSRVTK